MTLFEKSRYFCAANSPVALQALTARLSYLPGPEHQQCMRQQRMRAYMLVLFTDTVCLHVESLYLTVCAVSCDLFAHTLLTAILATLHRQKVQRAVLQAVQHACLTGKI